MNRLLSDKEKISVVACGFGTMWQAQTLQVVAHIATGDLL